jgi:tetratricopeptide (TPR) repeat protein
VSEVPPNGPSAALALARASLQRGDASAAKALAMAELGRPGFAAQALHVVALAEKALGDPAAAARSLRAALALQPNEPLFLSNLANLLAPTQPDEAEQCYRTALAAAPGFTQARVNLGLLLLDMSRIDEALAQAQAGLAHAPRALPLAQLRSMALLAAGDGAGALTAAELALSLAPGDQACRLHLARAAGAAMDWPRAQAVLVDLVRTGGPAPAAVWMALGEAFLAQSQTMAGQEALCCALAVEPNHEGAARQLTAALGIGAGNDHGGAYAAALALFPDSLGLAIAAFDEEVRAGRLAAAQAQLNQIAQRFATAQTEILRARLAIACGDAKLAASTLWPLYKAQPDRLITSSLAEALILTGDYGAAAEILGAQLARAPFDQHLLARLSTALRLGGDPKFADLGDPERLVFAVQIAPPAGMTLPAFNANLADHLRRRHLASLEPVHQSVRSGTQTEGQLFVQDRHPLVQHLRREVIRCVEAVAAGLPERPDHPFFGRRAQRVGLAGSWSVRLQAEGRHASHIHQEGWISSAYYVVVPPECADTQARNGWITFGQSHLPLGPHDAPLRMIQPEPGKLVLFPSYMWHAVTALTQPMERITVAFDAVPAL